MYFRERNPEEENYSNFTMTGYVSNAMVLVLAGIVILTSYYGINTVKKCKSNNGSNDSILRNEKILTMCMGLGVGLASFTGLNIFIDKVSLIVFGSLVITMSIIVIQSYEKLENTPNCKEKIQTTYNVMYGLLGAGFGIVFFTLLSNALTVIKSPLGKSRIMALLISIISIFIASVSINTSNSCKIKGISNRVSIIILVVNIVVFLGLAISLKYMK